MCTTISCRAVNIIKIILWVSVLPMLIVHIVFAAIKVCCRRRPKVLPQVIYIHGGGGNIQIPYLVNQSSGYLVPTIHHPVVGAGSGYGGAIIPQGGVVMPQGGAAIPYGGAAMTLGGAAMPYGGTAMPQGGATMPYGGGGLPLGGATSPPTYDDTFDPIPFKAA